MTATAAEDAGAGSGARARALYRALEQGDRSALDALLHPAFEGRTTAGLPRGLGGTYVGADSMRREFWGRVAGLFDAKVELDEVADLPGGRVLARGRYRGRARDGGGVLDAAFVHVLRFHGDGRLEGLEQVTDSQRWAEALDGGKPAHSTVHSRSDTAVGNGSDRRPATLETHDGLATITLRRPEMGNAIGVAMTESLFELATRCAEDRGIRAVLLRSTGDSFSVGGDLSLFATLSGEELGRTLGRMLDRFHAALARLSGLDAPVVCAVRGVAAGGGMGLVHVADVVVAAEDSRFVPGYGRLGLTPDGGNSWFLPRLVGLRRAQQMLLDGGEISAGDALECGLVTMVVPAAEVEPEAHDIARRLAAGPTRAFGALRRLLRDGAAATLDEQLAAEQAALVELSAGEDAQEGIAAFAGRREPRFRGR